MMDKEDYTDPACPFCTEQFGKMPSVRRIPIERVMAKLDALHEEKDPAGAARHLAYWLEEAKLGGDVRGQFTIYNELMGLYRKRGKRKKAIESAEAALALCEDEELRGTVSVGTAYLNAATVYKAFGEPQRSIELFERAKEIYEAQLQASDPRLGGLYNNMGLTLVDLKRYSEARELYQKALKVMKKAPNGELECAITHLNIASAAEAELGLEKAEEKIAACLAEAKKLLDAPHLPRNGYYQFVCDKCASVFGYYGYFADEAELISRAGKRVGI